MIAWALYYIGKYKIPKCCDFIVHVFIASLCFSYYYIVPFDVDSPMQYALRSVIICLRCSMAVAIFGVNGIIDVIAGLVMPLFFCMLNLKKTKCNDGSIAMCIPVVLITIAGSSVFNFIILEE